MTTLMEDDVLSGRYGPVKTRFRAERRTHTFELIDDISHAITSATVTLDTTASITRSARMRILPKFLPADFDLYNDHIAVMVEVEINSAWQSYPMGLFHIDTIDETWRMDETGTETWDVQCSDVSSHLFEYEATQPYTVQSGTYYTDAAQDLVVSLDLVPGIDPSGLKTIVPLTWPAGTSYGQIINDLLAGINYFPAWADRYGRITSRERIAPHLEAPAAVYTTSEEPRMMRDAFGLRFTRAQATNTIQVTVSSSSLAPSTIEAVNDDPLSPISAVNRGPSVSQVAGDRMPSSEIMMNAADYLVRDAAVRARTASLNTVPDPRRDAHEFYTIEVPGMDSRLYRAEGWTFDCTAGATMAHRLADASEIQVTVSQVVEHGAPIVPLTPIVINHPVTYRGMTKMALNNYGVTFIEPPGVGDGDCIVAFISGAKVPSPHPIPSEWTVLLDDTTNDLAVLTLARGPDAPAYASLLKTYQGELLLFACAAGTYLSLPTEVDVNDVTSPGTLIGLPTFASTTNGDLLFSFVQIDGSPAVFHAPSKWLKEKAEPHVASYACTADGGCASISGGWTWSASYGSFTGRAVGWVVPALTPTTIERERI